MGPQAIIDGLRSWRVKAVQNSLTKPPRSTAQQTAYQRTWYDKNRDRWNEYMKRYQRLRKLRSIPH